MFELSIALKYLVPRKKQLSVTLIAMMSVAVISLVVWLLVVFLSVTEGMEVSWLKKLTDLNAPIRITPTSEYYRSYYYKIDSVSSSSYYGSKTIGEKQASSTSNPYNPEEDPEISPLWPSPHLDAQGEFVDPVKKLFSVLEHQKKNHTNWRYQDYEMSGALLKLQLLRSRGDSPDKNGEETLNFLTQVSYLSTFPSDTRTMSALLLDPTLKDINHLFFLANYRLEGFASDGAPDLVRSEETFRELLSPLLSSIEIQEMETSVPYFEIPKHMLPKEGSFIVYGVFQENALQYLLLTQKNTPSLPFPHAKLEKGTLRIQEGLWQIPWNHPNPSSLPLIIEGTLTFAVHLDNNSLSNANQLKDLQFFTQGTLQGIGVQGILPWKDLRISKYKKIPSLTSPWPYEQKAHLHLPVNLSQEPGILLPKSFRDNGVLLGDRGFLSYNSSTASALQEQRLAVFVAGFYDPGVLSVGNKCLLVPSSIPRMINSSNSSFTFDRIALNGVQVWFDDLQSAENIKADIEAALCEQEISSYWNVSTYRDYDFAKDLLQQFQSDKYLFSLVGIIILIVACCNIISFLILLVNDKKKEIGILQAMGACKKSIALLFGSCGIVVGLIGSVIGLFSALLTLHHIDTIVQILSMLQGHDAFQTTFYGASLPNTLSSRAVWFILITTPLLSLIAGLIPAYKACRLQPSSILRSET